MQPFSFKVGHLVKMFVLDLSKLISEFLGEKWRVHLLYTIEIYWSDTTKIISVYALKLFFTKYVTKYENGFLTNIIIDRQ